MRSTLRHLPITKGTQKTPAGADAAGARLRLAQNLVLHRQFNLMNFQSTRSGVRIFAQFNEVVDASA